MSVFLIVRHTTMRSIAVLGRTRKGRWKDIAFETKANIVPSVVVLRVDESLYFGNIEQVKDMIFRIQRLGSFTSHPTSKSSNIVPVRSIIIDAENITMIDAVAIIVLKEMIEEYHHQGISFWFCHFRPSLERKVRQAGMNDNVVATMHDALQFALDVQMENEVASQPVQFVRKAIDNDIVEDELEAEEKERIVDI